MDLVAKLYKNLRCSFKAGISNLRPAKQNYLVRSPFTNCSNHMARIVVLYFMSLPSLQHLVLRTYEEPHWTINGLYIVFSTFVTNSENQELIWLKLHNLPSFSNIINSEGNGIVGGKLVRPARPCKVCFWPATREGLATPDLKLRLMLQSRAKYTAFLACQSFQRIILRWSWNEICIIISWNTGSWCARNSCEKRYSFFCFPLVITSAYIQVCISLPPFSHVA